MRLAALTICLLLASALDPAGLAHAGPNGECTCRHKSGDIPEGQIACISTPKGPMLARCDKFLNNTSWKVLDQACPSASLVPRGDGFGSFHALSEAG